VFLKGAPLTIIDISQGASDQFERTFPCGSGHHPLTIVVDERRFEVETG